ncbi:hypothetical protein [Candidatus Bandiella numerosa]|uniref:hypothetical protein n=1 Tax=Candidatus Bandiella numerosa TaxID=2570586 RepID=UPI001F3A9DB6|nr:hypothetical protein [Candidatus Bandiella numerosa]
MNFKNISICLTLLFALTVLTANATQTKQIQSTDLVDQDGDATKAGDENVDANKKATDTTKK